MKYLRIRIRKIRAKSFLAIVLSVVIAVQFLFNFQIGYAQLPSYLSSNDKEAVLGWIARETAANKTPLCYKASYGRGAGEVLTTCRPGEEKKGALCYPKCRDGYTAENTTPYVCSETCREGFSSSGVLTCFRPAKVVKGTRASCEPGWNTFPLTCSTKRIPIRTRPRPLTCPDGYRSDGVQCWLDAKSIVRDTYGRGAGTSLKCEDGLDQQGALCYPKCREGYDANGLTCLAQCPAGLERCGATNCAKDSALCAKYITGIVKGVSGLAGSIATSYLSTAFDTALKSLQLYQESLDLKKELDASAQQKQDEARRKFEVSLNLYAGRFEQAMSEMTPKHVNDTLKEKFGPQGYKWIVQEYAKAYFRAAAGDSMSLRDTTISSLASVIDPTGLIGVVNAFNKPICLEKVPFPAITVLNPN